MSQETRQKRARAEKEALEKRAAAEMATANPNFILPVHLDVTSALSLIGNLQLALRHPANKGPSAAIARRVIDGLIEKLNTVGLTATAEVARLGDNAAYDEEPEIERRRR
jgi:hypothetical protein